MGLTDGVLAGRVPFWNWGRAVARGQIVKELHYPADNVGVYRLSDCVGVVNENGSLAAAPALRFLVKAGTHACLRRDFDPGLTPLIDWQGAIFPDPRAWKENLGPPSPPPPSLQKT
jgi:hypothetical protein